jgi:hypothetical protein
MTDDAQLDQRARRAGELLRAEPFDAAARDRLVALVRDDTPVVLGGEHRFRWRPLAIVFASAASLLLGIGIGHQWAGGVPRVASLALGVPDSRAVEFLLTAPTAHDVALVGDFNDWNPRVTQMHRAADTGEWTASLPLPSGLHDYSFIVDDSTWVTDPRAPLSPTAWYGERTSVLVVANRSEQ